MIDVIRSRPALPAALLGLAATGLVVAAAQASAVWLVLVLAGLAVVAASCVVRDGRMYWLTIFLVTLPLNITKMLFFEPVDIIALRRRYDLFINDIDVPLLYLSDLALSVLLLSWAAEVVTQRRRISVPPCVVPAFAFVAWCLVSLAPATSLLLGLSWVFYQVKYIAVLLWTVNASLDRRALRWIMLVLAFNLSVQAGITIASYALQSGSRFYGDLFGVQHIAAEARFAPRHGGEGYVYETGSMLRGSGTIGVGNETAKFFVPLLPLALVSMLHATAGWQRAFFGGSFALGTVALYLTFSRGGMLSALIALGLVFLLMRARGLLAARTQVLVATGALVAGLAALPALYGLVMSRPGFTSMRVAQNKYGLQLLLEQPVIGLGINNFNVAVSKHEYEGVFRYMAVHNHYLRIGVETGLVGLLLYVSFFVWVARHAYRGVWQRDPVYSATAAGLFAGLIATMVYWLGDLFYSAALATQFWFLLGLAIVVSQTAAAAQESRERETAWCAGAVPGTA